ncbi:centrosomal protein of 19 kDa-like [Portunus trituberculatus]|uniref:centrosomal protein of 19 kDa-like n=1 Tax=Portunus trituberculatus TaxID=210409 RepID=UPI001E1CD004|nr:centrosomal protein of 19 kDa-like [Portunus trituberculatus]XP_045101556.1 centrosomal protein of 19 kDa-like [Portunus trituberculatus]XP_045101557.1 centrosomal protein of 19 kDa-like [Portunus trituberculatus]XP_045101558.1 centrosomal protein of 19 kDa-like [Portunus trituberculatus]XP_045101559.1 centrosomal protein of 19 kDa-like [Portunus trituberculatus]XP_045101560.1 centrosomal protein of 19 kDa-like [Portunus trituberculatus]
MEPLKLGVRTHPPGLTLVYRSAAGKERYRVMPIRFLNKFGSVENVLKEVKDRHQPFLDKVPDVRIEKMLRILQEVERGRNLEEATTMVGLEYSVDPEQDLNKLDDASLDKKKKVMNTSFEKNCVRPGDPDYEYDKQVDFGSGAKVEAGWDSPDEDFWS